MAVYAGRAPDASWYASLARSSFDLKLCDGWPDGASWASRPRHLPPLLIR